jgi:hypothetical protein
MLELPKTKNTKNTYKSKNFYHTTERILQDVYLILVDIEEKTLFTIHLSSHGSQLESLSLTKFIAI